MRSGAEVAEEGGGAAGTAVAVREASPRAISRYLNSLKPLLAGGTDARGVWVRFLNEAAQREDPVEAHAEAQQVALGQGQALDEARRTLAAVPVPPGLEDMHRSVGRWLKAVSDSCEVVFRSKPPLSSDTLARARQLVYEAGVEADDFNRHRTAVVESLQERPVSAQRPRFIASGKELRALALALVLALVMVGGVVYAMSTLTSSPPAPAPTPTPPLTDRRVFPQPDVLGRLRNELTTRKVAFNDADVQLVPPDRIIVKGRIQGPTALIPVEAELQMSVTPDGKPKVESKRLAAVGVTIPPEASDALNKRIDEANKTLPEQVPAGFILKRLYVENNAVVAELAGVAAAPKPGTKPGG
jgi:hypothetical protein